MRQFRKGTNLTIGYICNNICSYYFPAAISLFALIMMMSIADDYFRGYGEGIHYYLHFAFLSKYKAFLMIICAVPSILNFSRAWRNDAFIYYYTRSGKLAYPFSLCISAAVTSFIVAVGGSIVFMAVLSLREPFYPGNEVLLESCINSYAYGFFMKSGCCVLYYSFTIILYGLMAGFYAVVSTFISTIIIDPYLTVTVPMILCVFGTSVLKYIGIPKVINPIYIYSNTSILNYLFDPENFTEPSLFAAAFPFIYTSVMILLSGALTAVSLLKKAERAMHK